MFVVTLKDEEQLLIGCATVIAKNSMCSRCSNQSKRCSDCRNIKLIIDAPKDVTIMREIQADDEAKIYINAQSLQRPVMPLECERV